MALQELAKRSVPWGPREDGGECSICLDLFEASQMVTHLACGHAFHSACIDHWLRHAQANRRRTCPMCKVNPLSEAGGGEAMEAAAADLDAAGEQG